MKMIIDIDNEQVLLAIKNRALGAESKIDRVIMNALYNGTPLPDDLTNGDIIKAIFSNAEIKEIRGSFDKDKLLGYRTWLGGRSQDYLPDWWNAPYKAESEEK